MSNQTFDFGLKSFADSLKSFIESCRIFMDEANKVGYQAAFKNIFVDGFFNSAKQGVSQIYASVTQPVEELRNIAKDTRTMLAGTSLPAGTSPASPASAGDNQSPATTPAGAGFGSPIRLGGGGSVAAK